MFNEKFFAFLTVAVVILLSFLFAPADIGLRELVLVKMTYVALLFGTVFGLLHFLRGTKTDVIKEIFEEKNSAAALFVVGMIIALSLVIGR